jgi:CubicO group peptidase (beta-lactamase class C family)
VLSAACGPKVNQPPSAAPATVLTLQGLPVVLALDASDPDGDALTWTITTPPAHGALDGTAPAMTYTSESSWDGQDTFTFTVSDGVSEASAVISLDVLPVRGSPVPNQQALDTIFLGRVRELAKHGGLSVAASKDGKLVFARGYGYASPRVPMEPTSVSRIASVSKMITMATLMHLVEAGTVHLDDTLVSLVPELGSAADPRVNSITLRHLLEHRSGLPEDISGNGLFWTDSTLGAQLPCLEKLGEAFKAPLAAVPGEAFNYSNMGFCALTVVLERLSGRPLQLLVRDDVLGPMGVYDMRFEATSRMDRPDNEVRYYDDFSRPCSGATTMDQCRVLTTTGGAAAWNASTVDLTRVTNGIFGGFLKQESLAQVTTVTDESNDYGLGLRVFDAGGRIWAGHEGALDYSTSTYAYHTNDGWSWSVMINSTANFEYLFTKTFTNAMVLLDGGGDLYPAYPSPGLDPYEGP